MSLDSLIYEAAQERHKDFLREAEQYHLAQRAARNGARVDRQSLVGRVAYWIGHPSSWFKNGEKRRPQGRLTSTGI